MNPLFSSYRGINRLGTKLSSPLISSRIFSSFHEEDYETLTSSSNDRIKAVKKLISGGSMSSSFSSVFFSSPPTTPSSSSSKINSDVASTYFPSYKEINSKNFFLLEGYRSISDALTSNYSPLLIFVKKEKKQSDRYLEKKNSLISSLQNIQGFRAKQIVFNLEEKLFDSLSETVSSQGVIGLFYKGQQTCSMSKAIEKLLRIEQEWNSENKSTLASVSAFPPNFLCLNNISDPGNMGTLIRTAYGLNYEEIFVLGDKNVSLNSMKVVRSSMGMVLRTSLLHFSHSHIMLDYFIKLFFLYYYQKKISGDENTLRKAQIFIADIQQDQELPLKRYDQADYTPFSMAIIGSESFGPDTEAIHTSYLQLKREYSSILEKRKSSNNNGNTSNSNSNRESQNQEFELKSFFESHLDEEFLNDFFPQLSLVSIPMLNPVESYNAATAGSIIMAESLRQRNFES